MASQLLHDAGSGTAVPVGNHVEATTRLPLTRVAAFAITFHQSKSCRPEPEPGPEGQQQHDVASTLQIIEIETEDPWTSYSTTT